MLSSSLFSLALLGLSGAALGENVRWDQSDEKFWGKGLSGNGPYGFGGCDDQQSRSLREIFVKTGAAMEQQVYPEVLKGQESPAFKTFYGTSDTGVIARVWQDMSSGSTTRSIDGLDLGKQTAFFACVDPTGKNPSAQEVQQKCTEGKLARRFDATKDARFHWLLCPAFWDNNVVDDLPIQQQCPVWDGSEYSPSDGPLQVTSSRFSVIVQILAKTYSKNVTAESTDDDELLELNSIISSPRALQAANPMNYVSFSSMVVAGCPNYPDPADLGTKKRALSIRGRPADGSPATPDPNLSIAARSGSAGEESDTRKISLANIALLNAALRPS